MRALLFAKRNIKEIIREPISLIFIFIFPSFLLFMFSQFKIPNEVYDLINFAPSIIIFGFCFLTLFTSGLVSKDRTTSFLTRLFSSPMKSYDYILGYTLSMIPLVICQSIVFFLLAIIMGLEASINIIYTILIMIPISILYIGIGILIGSITSDKSSPAISSILLQIVCFTSGMWFDTTIVGSTFAFISKMLPFKYTLDISRNILIGTNNLLNSIIIVIVSIIIVYIINIILFKNKMNNDKL